MAFRTTNLGKSVASRLRGNAVYTTATAPKPKAHSPTADYRHVDHRETKPRPVKGEFVPVYVAIGMIALSAGLGLFTVYQQLFNSPTVRVSKKSREALLEVDDPDKVVDESSRFQNKSLFRKIAHVQEFEHAMKGLPDDIRRDAFAYKPHAETLKDVGVDAKAAGK